MSEAERLVRPLREGTDFYQETHLSYSKIHNEKSAEWVHSERSELRMRLALVDLEEETFLYCVLRFLDKMR